MTSSHENVSRASTGFSGNGADRLFDALFYRIFGWFTFVAGVIGRTAFQVPFFVITGLIILRAVMRPSCRQRMWDRVSSVPALILLALFGVVLIYAVAGLLTDARNTRLLGKAAIFALGLLFLTFLWGHRSIIDRERLGKMMVVGVYCGVAGVILVAVLLKAGHVMTGSTAFLHIFPKNWVTIYAQNDQLKILSVLGFFVAAFIDSKPHRYTFVLVFATLVFVLSFFTFGGVFDKETGKASLGHVTSETVQFGLPGAVLAYALATRFPKAMVHIVFLAAAILLFAAPWIFQAWYSLAQTLDLPKAQQFLVRAEIWDTAARQSLTSPLFGHGLDATRYANILQFENTYYKGQEVWHPHNMFVQVWLDLGLIGVSLFLALLWAGWRATWRLSGGQTAAILAGVVMAIATALVTHSLWQTWTIILAFVATGLASLLGNHADKPGVTGAGMTVGHATT